MRCRAAACAVALSTICVALASPGAAAGSERSCGHFKARPHVNVIRIHATGLGCRGARHVALEFTRHDACDDGHCAIQAFRCSRIGTSGVGGYPVRCVKPGRRIYFQLSFG